MPTYAYRGPGCESRCLHPAIHTRPPAFTPCCARQAVSRPAVHTRLFAWGRSRSHLAVPAKLFRARLFTPGYLHGAVPVRPYSSPPPNTNTLSRRPTHTRLHGRAILPVCLHTSGPECGVNQASQCVEDSLRVASTRRDFTPTSRCECGVNTV
eukprot:scaffold23157_cov103-Isochrysis_galbana.AAC.3